MTLNAYEAENKTTSFERFGFFPFIHLFLVPGLLPCPKEPMLRRSIGQGVILQKGVLAGCGMKRKLGWGSVYLGAVFGGVRCGDTQSRPLIFLASPICMPPDKSRNYSEPPSPPLKLVTMPITPLWRLSVLIYTDWCVYAEWVLSGQVPHLLRKKSWLRNKL